MSEPSKDIRRLKCHRVYPTVDASVAFRVSFEFTVGTRGGLFTASLFVQHNKNEVSLISALFEAPCVRSLEFPVMFPDDRPKNVESDTYNYILMVSFW